MRLIIQRVSEAKIIIDNSVYAYINKGLVVLLGIKNFDEKQNADWLVNKLINLRIFNDDDNKMNKSLIDIKGEILIVSNFTLYGNSQKGFRPSFIDASKPEHSEPLYDYFIEKIKQDSKLKVESGKFGADMKVHLINDGPVTLFLEK